MRKAIFLACALGSSPVDAAASDPSDPLAQLVIGLARDVVDAAVNGDSSAAGSRVRRRLQASPLPSPSDDTMDKISNAANAVVLKLAGDASDCASLFAPLGGGAETAEMRTNQDKLEESVKHFPFGGFYSLARWGDSPTTCACDMGFTNPYDTRCECDAYYNSPVGDGSSCPPHVPCDSASYDDPNACQYYTSTACTTVPYPTNAMVNLAEAGVSLRFNKDGADSDATMYIYDGGDDYSDNCPWTFKGCKNFNLAVEITSKKDSAGPGVPEDDVTATSTFSAQVPVCAPDDCFDDLGDLVDDLNDFIIDVTTALNGDPALSTKFEIGDITVDAGFCWPRWYNMVFMIFGTLLCLGGSAFATKKFLVNKKLASEPLHVGGFTTN